jgi:Fur family ferric uptake transcriptional regulator
MAILHVLRHTRGHLEPTRIYAEARKAAPGLTQPTVYRTLDVFVRNGLVWQMGLDKGHLAYELAEGDHHHLVCRSCGRQVEVSQNLFAEAYRQLEASSGYALDLNHVRLSGLCPACRKKRAQQKGDAHVPPAT